jgi:hypothetical protein
MVYNAKNVVGLIEKILSIFFAVSDYAYSGMGEVGDDNLLEKEFRGMPVDDWQIRFGVKGR